LLNTVFSPIGFSEKDLRVMAKRHSVVLFCTYGLGHMGKERKDSYWHASIIVRAITPLVLQIHALHGTEYKQVRFGLATAIGPLPFLQSWSELAPSNLNRDIGIQCEQLPVTWACGKTSRRIRPAQ
jgi:hypothetical protein